MRCEIGERLVEPNGVGRPGHARAPRNLLPGRGGEQLLVQGREARDDLRPAVSAAVCLSASATRPAFLLIASGRDERVDERLLVVGPNEPARPSVGETDKHGSDGTRTRDLRRDRPVSAPPGWAGTGADSRRSRGFSLGVVRGLAGPAGASGDVLRDERDAPLSLWETSGICARTRSWFSSRRQLTARA